MSVFLEAIASWKANKNLPDVQDECASFRESQHLDSALRKLRLHLDDPRTEEAMKEESNYKIFSFLEKLRSERSIAEELCLKLKTMELHSTSNKQTSIT